MAGHLGTAQNMAAMPVQFEKNVINFFPLTASARDVRPFPPSSSTRSRRPTSTRCAWAVPKLVKEKGAKKVCTMYQDDDFGLEVMRGAEAGLKSINMEFAEKTSYKRGATDFSSQVARMKARLGPVRLCGAGHHHPRDHRHHRRKPQDSASRPPSWAAVPPTPT